MLMVTVFLTQGAESVRVSKHYGEADAGRLKGNTITCQRTHRIGAPPPTDRTS